MRTLLAVIVLVGLIAFGLGCRDQEKENLIVRLKQLQKDYDDVQKKLSDQGAEVKKLRDDKAGLEEKVKGLQSEMSKLTQEKDALVTEKDALVSENDKLTETMVADWMKRQSERKAMGLPVEAPPPIVRKYMGKMGAPK
ncbi:MAG: hypothetical protein WC980_05930 [Candidatus Brocadiia bacterium]